MNSILSVVLVHRDDYERGQLRLALEALSGVQIRIASLDRDFS